MSYKVEYTSKARKDLKKVPLDIAQNIILSINSIKCKPYSYIKKIKGTKNHPLYTYRVSEYRVILDIEGDRLLIIVIEAGHRRKRYRKY
ncbi:MAG: type II toxin-antitoxin system RelE/ParE family toxin [Euryarchaeota archaeon]|nr:type II toxin-antitoxin system RelE/ParE family toxin [Euryarchaeota archaeon]MBU4139945.1 type II toxin-antitoxin system RelE/ParE family toxin [Euryarchaeota archaeon]